MLREINDATGCRDLDLDPVRVLSDLLGGRTDIDQLHWGLGQGRRDVIEDAFSRGCSFARSLVAVGTAALSVCASRATKTRGGLDALEFVLRNVPMCDEAMDCIVLGALCDECRQPSLETVERLSDILTRPGCEHLAVAALNRATETGNVKVARRLRGMVGRSWRPPERCYKRLVTDKRVEGFRSRWIRAGHRVCCASSRWGSGKVSGHAWTHFSTPSSISLSRWRGKVAARKTYSRARRARASPRSQRHGSRGTGSHDTQMSFFPFPLHPRPAPVPRAAALSRWRFFVCG